MDLYAGSMADTLKARFDCARTALFTRQPGAVYLTLVDLAVTHFACRQLDGRVLILVMTDHRVKAADNVA